MGLDNLVANTAYLKAQQIDRNELRKQRLYLTLPKIKKHSALLEEVGIKYKSLCEEQPIGKKLFQQFLLNSQNLYAATAEFLEELNDWSIGDDESRKNAIHRILAKFCHPESMSFLSFLSKETLQMCNESDKKCMDQLREATRDFLQGKPFSEYLKSPFFYKFLQWKEFEKQNITDRYFYEFRMLGKGGFGEVGAKEIPPSK